MSNKEKIYESILEWVDRNHQYEPQEIKELNSIISKQVELLSEKEAKDMLIAHLIDYVFKNYYFPVKSMLDKINLNKTE